MVPASLARAAASSAPVQAARAARRAVTEAESPQALAKEAVGEARKRLARKRTALYYRSRLDEQVRPDLAVFAAYWERGVLGNPAAIAAKAAEIAPHIQPVWVVRRDLAPMVPAGTDQVVRGTRRYWDLVARARFMVNNVNFANTLVKRPESTHLMTHHGTPLKRMGMDQRFYPESAGDFDFERLAERCARWTYSLSSNRHSTNIWNRVYPGDFETLEYGYPRNDVYYTADADQVLRARERFGIPDGKTAILYAPTHRDYLEKWQPRIDAEALLDALGEDFVLLVRGHYFYDTAAARDRSGRMIDVSGYNPVEEVCLAADLLLTDYSSIMFDYANLDRPMVIFADDWETYVTKRGVYFDLTERPPGPVATTQDELTELLRFGAWRTPESERLRADFRRAFCEFDDGHAAERVVRKIFSAEDAVPPIVPLEDRTPAPTPAAAAGHADGHPVAAA